MRDAEIVSGEVPSQAWLDVIGGRKLLSITTAEFGAAEELLGLLEFVDGTYEVGLGEPLRPYARLYLGDSRREAHGKFWNEVRAHADWDEE
ncbi:MAG: hypothetical protein ACM32E_09905 [Gemmatimonadota bacterium]